MKKDRKDFTFDEVVDWCAERILTELMVGKFRSGVYAAVDFVCMWREEQKEKIKK